MPPPLLPVIALSLPLADAASWGSLRRDRGGLRAAAEGDSELVEAGYRTLADRGFIEKCLPLWQHDCEKSFRDEEIRAQLCHSHLDRLYCKNNLQLPLVDAQQRWASRRAERQWEAGWISANLPRFTPTGFKKMRLPAELHNAVSEWFLKHRHSDLIYPEDVPSFGDQCGDGIDNDDWLLAWGDTAESRRLIPQVREHIRRLLSEWTGLDVNECVAVFGVRMYHRGSVCGLHTDQPETHAFSAIYNVHQTNMDKPWALDHVAHDGTRGQIFQEPGEIVLYESASSLHGRASPLQGDEYANIFFHFRSPNWLPAIQPVMERRWDEKMDYMRSAGRSFETLMFSQTRRRFAAEDDCLPIKSRNESLLAHCGAFDTPTKEDYDFAAAVAAGPRPRP